MYGWIWQHLPGNRAIKAIEALALLLAVVWVLFNYVFPALEPILPIGRDAVNHGGAFGQLDPSAGAPLGRQVGGGVS